MDYTANNIKNIALTGHGGSGKTSLAEALLYFSKATDRLGKVVDGTTICDYDTEEIKRKSSVSLSIAPFNCKNYKVNLIDIPGLFDFEGELHQGIRPAESVIIALSGKSGVTVGAEESYKAAVKAGKSTMFFVSKLDTENADFYKVLSELKTIIGPTVCPIIVPHYENEKVACYINLLTLNAYKYENGVATEVVMPNTGHRLDGLMVALNEAIAETDDELMEKFFSGEQFTKDEMIKGLKLGVKKGIISPVYCGSAYTLEGIDQFAQGIAELLPTAYDVISVAEDKSGNPVEVSCDEKASLSAFVFKTIADPFVGKMSYAKIMSGKLSSDIAPINARTGNPERLGKIMFIKGKKQTDTGVAMAGDIVALSKLSETITGDTLCDPKRVIAFEQIDFPNPCLSMAIKPKAKGDETKISGGIHRLIEEDPTLKYENNHETHQQIITGLGEQHLDVVVSKLKTKFGVDV
ncbi:MAG: elongation factor G, partial [Oscillospiraceae bacterium]|nr:elongation factor G [Oscillospiraceae bacterium]